MVESRLGKLAPDTLERLILPHLGAARPEVRVGPRVGADCAIVRLGAGRVMAVTTDPFSLVPAWGLEMSARCSCHLLASDLWTSGIPPAYASLGFLLSPGFDDAELGIYWKAMSAEWEALDVAVVAGHTGRHAGCESTVIGLGTLIGVGDEGRALTAAMAGPGDVVIVTKGCAIEATAVAAWAFPGRLALDAAGLARARALVDQVSVVSDCRAALRVGVGEHGVTSLHDATEGGVLGGLLELAHASGLDLRVEQQRIPLSAEARAACEAFGGIDPYWTLSQGTLIVTARPARAATVLESLAQEGITGARVGEMVPGSGKLWLTSPDGAVRVIAEPTPDPYWAAYERSVREAWA